MMLSSPFWGFLSDRYGRRRALWASVCVLFFYGAVSSFSTTYFWLLFFRFFVGFAVGCVPQSVTLYAEFLPSKQRARCVVLLDVHELLLFKLKCNNIIFTTKNILFIEDLKQMRLFIVFIVFLGTWSMSGSTTGLSCNANIGMAISTWIFSPSSILLLHHVLRKCFKKSYRVINYWLIMLYILLDLTPVPFSIF